MKKTKIILVISCLSVLIALAVMETILRIGVVKPKIAYPGNEALFRGISLSLDRQLMFRLTPNCREDINNYGYRDNDFTKAKTGKKRVIFLGDSFVMGLHVESENTLPRTLEKTLGDGYEVYNMGVYGYGPDQSLVQLTKEGLDLSPDMVILNVYPSNDFNDIYINKIFSVDARGGLRFRPKNALTERLSSIETINYFRHVMFARSMGNFGMMDILFMLFRRDNNDMAFIKNEDAELSKEKYMLMRGVLGRMKKTLDERKIRFLVTVLPSYWNIQDDAIFREAGIRPASYFVNEDIVNRICDDEGIPHINLYPFFLSAKKGQRLYDEKDHHLNVLGHEFVSRIILENIAAR